jgi:dihydrodipicolinate reductase
MYVLIFGSGLMAQELAKVCDEQKINYDYHTFKGSFGRRSQPDTLTSQKDAVIVNFGSSKNLHRAIEWSEKFDITLIQGSTSQVAEIDLSTVACPNSTIIMAPNLSLPIVRFMKSFPVFADTIKSGMEMSILESHQSSKKDTSGTARAIASDLNFPIADIESVRKASIQQALGVPLQHRGGHAHHHFILSGLGVEISVSTKVNGRRTYAMGALEVASMALRHKKLLPKFRDNCGIIPLTDIIHLLDE